MPTTKRRSTYDACNKYRLGIARGRVEYLNATMNAHLHINSAIVFEADVTALHGAAEPCSTRLKSTANLTPGPRKLRLF